MTADLSWPQGATAALRVEGVRDETGALVADADVRATISTMPGVALEGATNVQLAAVDGEAGTYQWLAPASLGLAGRYRLRLLVTKGASVTPIEWMLRVVEYRGEESFAD